MQTNSSGGGGGDGSDASQVSCDDAAGGAWCGAPAGVRLVLTGSVPALGCWDPAAGLQLACDESGVWRASLELPMGYPVQAKVCNHNQMY
jgi:hypothetical protein